MRRLALLLATLAPAAGTLAFVLAYGTDFPRHDEWNMVSGIARLFEGTLTLDDLWSIQNEHFAFFPHLAIAGLARLTAWNLRAEMLGTLAFMGGALWMLARLLRRIPGMPAWAPVLASCFLFSLHGIDNWLWGCTIQFAMGVFGATFALALLGRDDLGRGTLSGAALLALLASWSFLSGFLAWPLGAALILLRPGLPLPARLGRLGVWTAAAAFAIAVPWSHLPITAAGQRAAPLEAAAVLDFVARYLGATLLGSEASVRMLRLAGGVALPALAAGSTWALLRRRTSPAATAFVAIGLFGLLTGFLIAIGRLGAGAWIASTSRYTMFSGPAWILLLLLPALVAPAAGPRLRIAHGAAAAAAVLVLAFTSPPHFDDARERDSSRTAAAAALRKGEGITADVLLACFGNPIDWMDTFADRLAALRRWKLSFFRNATHEELEPAAWPGRITGRLVAGTDNGRPVADLEARGGVPGNVVFVFVDVARGRDAPRKGPATFDADGVARLRFETGPEPVSAKTLFKVYSLDRAGRVVFSEAAPIELR